MNWQRIEQILRDCTKEPAIPGTLPPAIPPDYAEFLRRFNGIEGFVGPEQYLMLWRAEQVEELNTAYATAEHLPGVLLIGTDGSDTGFGVDAGGRYKSVPLVAMSLAEIRDIGGSFEEFLERIAS